MHSGALRDYNGDPTPVEDVFRHIYQIVNDMEDQGADLADNANLRGLPNTIP
jgi:hypothetical protein